MASAASSVPLTLAEALWPARLKNRFVRALLLALGGSILLTLSAKMQVPFYPVPMTLQTMVVLLIGMAYGSSLGLATVALYLAEGALGLPVFAGTPEKGIGVAYMLGPTGGYLLGFALAAFVSGWIVERRRDAGAILAAVLAGTLLMYIPGVLWLSSFVGLEQALALGVLPFVWAELVKMALATALGLGGAAVLRRRLEV